MDEERTYEYLIEKFQNGRNRFIERQQNMHMLMVRHLYKLGLFHDYEIHELTLNQCIIDYFADIARLKDFHFIERVKPEKVFAYMSYWVARNKPIVPRKRTGKFFPVNESFSTAYIMSYLTDGNAESSAEMVELQKHILYHLRYRAFSPQSIELMLMAFNTGKAVGKPEQSPTESP